MVLGVVVLEIDFTSIRWILVAVTPTVVTLQNALLVCAHHRIDPLVVRRAVEQRVTARPALGEQRAVQTREIGAAMHEPRVVADTFASGAARHHATRDTAGPAVQSVGLDVGLAAIIEVVVAVGHARRARTICTRTDQSGIAGKAAATTVQNIRGDVDACKAPIESLAAPTRRASPIAACVADVIRYIAQRDIVTVIVDYRSSMLSEGEAETRKTSNFNAVLQEWIGFDGKSIFRGPQSRGDPAISGNLNSQFRAEGELELRDSLTFRIAAKIVDIRPNGNLVIEAHRTITINDEVWQQSLTGVVRRQAIGPDRTVRSDSIADLKIHKRELGQVRNAYAPGWLNWWWSQAKPF